MPAATPIILQSLFSDTPGSKILYNSLVKQSPIRITETIYTLFYITNNKIRVIMSNAFVNKRPEIIPLHSASILKLINHVIVYLRTHFLIYERGITTSYNPIKKLRSICNQHYILFFPIFSYVTRNISQNSQCVIIADYFFRCIIRYVLEAVYCTNYACM